MDVVPAERDKWTVDPWAATVRDGAVYGRGTQDMKCVSIQYLEAIGARWCWWWGLFLFVLLLLLLLLVVVMVVVVCALYLCERGRGISARCVATPQAGCARAGPRSAARYTAYSFPTRRSGEMRHALCNACMRRPLV